MYRNVTIIGPRCVGKSTLCSYIGEKTHLKYVKFDDVLEEQLSCYGGLTASLRSSNANYVLNIWAPQQLKQILSQTDLLLEIGAGAISSNNQDSNRINIQTLASQSLIIPILPYKNLEKSIDILLARENLRKEDKLFVEKEVVEHHYIRFLEALKENNLFPLYVRNKEINEIYETIRMTLECV